MTRQKKELQSLRAEAVSPSHAESFAMAEEIQQQSKLVGHSNLAV